MAFTATSGPDLGNLWAIYLNAKFTADNLTEMWAEVQQSGGWGAGSASYYSQAYVAHEAADLAYNNWLRAWQRINPAPPSGPPPQDL